MVLPFKMILLGDTGCGKSSLLHYWLQYARGNPDVSSYRYRHDTPTIGVEFGTAYVLSEESGDTWKFNIWDTGGQERFRCITRNYYRDCDIVVFVYDIMDARTFHNVDMWVNEVFKHYASKDDHEQPYMILIGNKTDRDPYRQVSQREGAEYAKRNGMMFFETSIKNGTSVIHAWRNMTKKVISDAEISGVSQYDMVGMHRDIVSMTTPDESCRGKKCCNVI